MAAAAGACRGHVPVRGFAVGWLGRRLLQFNEIRGKQQKKRGHNPQRQNGYNKRDDPIEGAAPVTETREIVGKPSSSETDETRQETARTGELQSATASRAGYAVRISDDCGARY